VIIATKLGLGAAQSWSADEAIVAWGHNMAVFSLGSNSRARQGRRRTRLIAEAPLDYALDRGRAFVARME
jgi:hypothetical protein